VFVLMGRKEASVASRGVYICEAAGHETLRVKEHET